MKPINIMNKLNESSETESKWVYVSKHGLGPGTVPKDIEISNVYDEPNSMNTVFCSNRKLTQEELNKYELKPFIKDKEIKEDNFSIDDKVDLIDIYGDYYQYDDILEDELGYEFMLKLYDDMTGNNNLIIYKEKSGNEDFIIMDKTESGGTMYKVDHNGERLFFSENEAKALVKEDE